MDDVKEYRLYIIVNSSSISSFVDKVHIIVDFLNFYKRIEAEQPQIASLHETHQEQF